MLGIVSPLNVQTSLPSSVCTTCGAASAYFAANRPSNMSGAIIGGDARTPEELEQFRRDDHLDSDPVGGYRRSGRALLDAFSEPGVLDETFPTPIGVAPGNAVVHLRITELLVHGWDLAR